MKNVKKILAALFAVCCFVSSLAFSTQPVQAATNILPTASDNLSVELKSTSKLVATSDGYMRVFYDGEKVVIEYYDNSFNIKSKKSLNMELDWWGGFYAGSNAYYLVEGKSNTAEKDSAEVIRVIKYDTKWNKKGTAKITSNPDLFGGDVRFPFHYGCVEMTEYNGTLYIVTGHQGYVDPAYNQGHQGFLMIAVNEASMTGKIVDCDLWHSFAQYITNKGSDLYVLEQSEGSRYTKLSKYNTGNYTSTSLPVLEYGGSHTSAWAIACYASVDGMALSSSNVLCLGTSIDQSKYDSVSSDTAHNIYLTVTPMSNFSKDATTVKWLTNYSGKGKCFLGTKITKINDNRFLVSWEEYDTSQSASTTDTLSGSILHYIFIDGKGNKVGKEFTAAAPISDCQPIVKGSKIVYCASSGNMVNFYSIDSETGKFSKKIYRVAGNNATWELNKNTLTISGTGTISVDTEANFRAPVSSTSGMFVYSSSDTAWAPIANKVKKLVISNGITGISERSFAYFSNLEEVNIASGVKSIGKEAFFCCSSLSKIKIPSSVTSIGADILWTGYWGYDDSHVVRATIYSPPGSTAIKYAKKNNIKYEIDISAEKVSGISVSNVADGVKIKWNKLSGATKYRVFYKTGSGKWTKAGDTTSTSFTWTKGKSGTKYTFTVRCIDNNGNYVSDYNRTGKSITYLNAPAVTKAVAANKNGITITWKKVTGAKSYQLWYKKGDGNWEKLKKVSSTSYTWTKAKAGTTYKFAVTAIAKDDTSSAKGSTKTLKYAATPKAPTVKKVKSGIQISWKKTTGAVKYQIFYQTDSGKWKKLAATTNTSYTWKNAQSGKTYTFTVRCVTKDGKTYTSGYNAKGTSIKYKK